MAEPEYKVIANLASDFTGENYLVNKGFECFDDADSFYLDALSNLKNNYDEEIEVCLMYGEKVEKSEIINEPEDDYEEEDQ